MLNNVNVGTIIPLYLVEGGRGKGMGIKLLN